MAEKSSIGWTDATLNLLGGCAEDGLECAHCYARGLTAQRFAANPVSGFAPYRKLATVSASGRPQWTREYHFFKDRLHKADRWSPRKIFLNDLSDTFYEPVTIAELDAMFLMMERLSQHTWQVLTKRAARMATYARDWPARMGRPFPRHIWMGCTTGVQASFEERWAHLSTVDVAVRFLSIEPMLEAMDIRAALTGVSRAQLVIIGGESGPSARPFNLAWVRSIVRQCRDASVPVFVKQDSGPRSGLQGRIPDDLWIKEFPSCETR